ncbi:hypothetical protein DPMN_077378 [Dreissena polymorpha]|uniref:VWFC domain-containing protein n=1 Tax=Dreissena polymorpha TaxID=45954 RepID=A0A9D4BPA1_DREPO|nr:hypothetical protein DPMN_077378 [Dreissena polymorpha]
MNGKDYKEGENVPSDNPCQTCTCRNGDVDCVYTVCVPPTCPNTYTPKGKCCLECVQGCTMNGKTYKDGDAVPTKDPCENCTCNNGDVDCDFTACAPPPCDVSYTPAAKCCPVCRTDCVRNEKTYKDGESVPDDNPCATCKCAKGVVKCGYKDCTPLTCAALYKPKGECCAKCKEGCEKNGQKYEHGQPVPDRDPCKTCRCLNGEVKCDTISCPKLACYDTFKPSGRQEGFEPAMLVPVESLRGGCTRDGKTYEHGKPVPDADPCRNWTCDNGRVKCDIVVCPILNCYVTVPQPGKCCPICKECYNTPSADPCKYCTCVDGKVECEDYTCPKLTCAEYDRIKPNGKCCQVCKEKKPCKNGPYGKDYDDGDYIPDYKPCKKCRCNYGNIECEDIKYGC